MCECDEHAHVKTGSIDTSAKEATDITGVKKDISHGEALKAGARLTKLAAGNVQPSLKLKKVCIGEKKGYIAFRRKGRCHKSASFSHYDYKFFIFISACVHAMHPYLVFPACEV
jgi:hypothetical protein